MAGRWQRIPGIDSRFCCSKSRAASVREFCRSVEATGSFNHWRGDPTGPFSSSSLLPGDLGKGRLILWDVKSATEIGSIGGGAQLTNLSFSPDGSKLAARNQAPTGATAQRPTQQAKTRRFRGSGGRSQNVRRRKISRSNRSCTSRTTRASSCSLSGSTFQAIASRIMDRCNREKIASKQPALGMPGLSRMPPVMSSAISSPGSGTRKAVITGAGAIDILSTRTGERLSRLNSDLPTGPGARTARKS